ncbi:DUF4405 domain-containing protein [Desulforhopalus sp. IMCC35007]|uniref:DUF4405 domain-containing protein n=1 Tax=Desulforhopalus sp. IMCC35007 TaxID=2569543 RepID=UPI0010AE7819|nr:DUF4405 domain-containing protein [Desulforhopalus sp. IMCC35007]TKB11622.1 DUF4405 domain-containing protein [Desulforhopalus sp. IMCC35007]
MNMRRVVSLTLVISLVPLLITSVVLYIVPEGRVAFWSDWKMLGLTKTQWGDIHINLGWLFLLAGLLHLYLNWKPIVLYMKNKAKKLKVFTVEFNISFFLTVVCVAGTLMGIPPFSTIIDFGASFKEAAALKYGEPPYGHAELSSLQTLTRRTGLDLELVMVELSAAGLKSEGEQQTVLEVAQLNKVTPKEVWQIMQKAQPVAAVGERPVFPDEPFPGFGRKTLEEICNTYGFDCKNIIAALRDKGVVAGNNQTIKDIADTNNTDPHLLFELLRTIVTSN